jgi:hypothetical protein
MADYDEFTAGLKEHVRGNLAGISPFLLPKDILRAEFQDRTGNDLFDLRERYQIRADNDIIVLEILEQADILTGQVGRFRDAWLHFPISDDYMTFFHTGRIIALIYGDYIIDIDFEQYAAGSMNSELAAIFPVLDIICANLFQ